MKRLYIGGLAHTISQKDLKDRFGKFGDVSDVEIVSRKDETGIPVKTFAYININISDEAFRKCMTVLNKSKWKGGTLQIELAKESFLHRLAAERQKAVEKTESPKPENKEQLVESFKKAGVENFHMKAAVPGTEIPGHKYDPSKHSHNIKKLESTADVPPLTPVSQLTWEIQGGDNEISKKRRGEFPPQKARPAKIRKETLCKMAESSNSIAKQNGQSMNLTNSLRVGHNSNAFATGNLTGHDAPGIENRLPAIKRQSKSMYVFDSEGDSDDEIRKLVAQENMRVKDVSAEDEDNLEVVGDNFTVKPNMFWASGGSKGEHAGVSCKETESGREYDSADTDEILTQSKTPAVPEEQREADESQSSGQNCDTSCLSYTSPDKCDLKPDASKRKKKPDIKAPPKPPSSASESSDEESEGCSDSDYESMMANCQRIELSLVDLEQLARAASAETNGDTHGSDSEPGTSAAAMPSSKGQALAAPTAKKGNTPEEILAAILEEDSSDEENDNSKKKKKKVKKKTEAPSLPAFKGTKTLLEAGKQTDKTETSLKSKEPESAESSSDSSSSDGEERGKSHKDPKPQPLKAAGKTEESVPKGGIQTKAHSSASVETTSIEHPGAKKIAITKDSKQVEEQNGLLKKPHQKMDRAESIQQKQQDNQKRLAALEQKQKEAEQQRKLIQGALSSVDAPVASKGKHIVFDSDNESGEEAEQSAIEPAKSLFDESSESSAEEPSEVGDVTRPKQSLKTKDCQKKGGGKLFDSSEDDDDDDDEEDGEDGTRFQIKPQFEGKAGQKLMKLQSQFGTDERFRMDSRFLESDDDESNIPEETSTHTDVEVQLKEEKKKNLDILQSLLNINVHGTEANKEATKSKTFKDISALHYDPTREDHAAFERNMEKPKKESKAEKRKKREEAEKLPEVSKEIYYDVAVDLKEVFGSQKESAALKPQDVAWDEEEEREEEKEEEEAAAESTTGLLSLCSSNASAEKEESTGFQFSFFRTEAAEDTSLKEDYKIEILKGAKAPWMANPSHRDSSSEDEEEDKMEDGAGDKPATASATG
ncbi:hypothetical protein JZ751_029824 [Albula glossodonta]|uniref:Nucleolar protein 8 n=1 Tax=Albula glossodonta TaxID=121402 RepID=A0A8T2NB39_9TELE|nr:hypothetical protein JZ751_029824 [Albula glossodonta]